MVYTCEACWKKFERKDSYTKHKTGKTCSEKIITVPTTFEELYRVVFPKTAEEFKVWLTDSPWVGSDKQESSFRMFTALGLFPCLEGYTVCQGNFSRGEIEPLDLEKFWKRGIKDVGDKSDLTLVKGTEIFAFTSKNKEGYQVGGMGTDAIIGDHTYHYSKKYPKLRLGIVVDDRKRLDQACKGAHKSSERFVKLLTDPNTLVIDNRDLIQAFRSFKANFSKQLPEKVKKCLFPYFHQELLARKISNLLSSCSTALCSAISRSGKTYVMGRLVKLTRPDNILIVTLRPTETTEAYREFFTTFDFSEYTLSFLGGKTRKPKLGQKNIIVASKQFLQGKTEDKLRNIKWLQDTKFDLFFIDEPHDGGSTPMATKAYSTYGGGAKRVLFTSTYNKPVNVYSIPSECIVGWDMEDILLCKNLTKDTEDTLVHKHGDVTREVLGDFSRDEIIKTYSRYPEMVLLSDSLEKDQKAFLEERIEGTDYGWSLKALFCLDEQGNFKKEEAVEDYMKHIFGKEDDVIPDDTSVMARFERYSRENGSRYTSKDSPLTVLMFVSPEKVTQVSRNIKAILDKLYNFEVQCVNSGEKVGKATDSVSNAEKRAVNSSRKATVIIASKMCTTGITLKKCDIVLMLDDCKSYDDYYQKIFRCMTEDSGKRFGYIYDPNIQRVFRLTARYFVETFPREKDKKKAIEKALQQRLIIFHSNYFKTERRRAEMITYMYKQWLADMGVTDNIIQEIKNVSISEKYQTACNKLFTFPEQGKSSKKGKKEEEKDTEELEKTINEALGGKDTDFPKGLVEDKEEKEDKDSETGEDEETSENASEESKEADKKRNLFLEILPNLTVFSIYFTVHEDIWSLGDMLRTIKTDEVVLVAMMDYLRTNLGKKIPDRVLDLFIEISDKDLVENDLITEHFRQIKERFRASWGQRDFYLLVEKYFIPFEVERKDNGEVSTPIDLAEKMIATLPETLWTKKTNTFFEPCCGKGVFLFLAFQRFMSGLSTKIPDEEKRKKFILEKNLYFGDINPCNILFCKRLLDPKDEYTLNSYQGDTLKLDTKKTFKISKFTMIVSNPPYSTNPSKQGTTPLYNLFIEKYIDNAEYFLFITPSRWFSGGKGLDKFRKFMLSRKDISLIQHFENCRDCFPTVNIEGGVSYFLKVPEETPCLYNGIEIDLSKYDTLVDPKYIELIEKTRKHPSIQEIFMTRGHYNVETNDENLHDEKKPGDVVCYVSKNKGRTKYIDKRYHKDSVWKVITARANGKNKRFGFMTVIPPEQIYTNSYVGFRVKSKEEGESLISYLKCKLPTTLLASMKISQDISTKTVKWIPKVPLDRIWDDDLIDTHFGLKKREIFTYTTDGRPIYLED